MTLPAAVTAVCETFLAELPDGLLTGLYLRGGLGFGEWVPGQSDVDFVATLARRPTPADVAGSTEAACWCVLGVARLHHLLVTGGMTTKSAAGRWGLTYYPERFHRVLREALRVREGGDDEYPRDPAARGHDTGAFTAYVVESGTR